MFGKGLNAKTRHMTAPHIKPKKLKELKKTENKLKGI